MSIMQILSRSAAVGALALFSMAAIAQDAGTGSKVPGVDVAPVDVPEKSVVQPTSKEIHDDYPEMKCSACHTPSNLDAESKPLTHFLTTKECNACHFTQSWIPLRIYTHLSAKYRPDPARPPQECALCHTSNSEFLAR